MNHVLFSTIFNIGVVLFISLILIRKNYYVRGLKIFIFLFIIGQVLGYGLGVDILKSVIPSSSNPKSGVSYQIITSTILPLLLAFIAKDI
jgi:predicted permease